MKPYVEIKVLKLLKAGLQVQTHFFQLYVFLFPFYLLKVMMFKGKYIQWHLEHLYIWLMINNWKLKREKYTHHICY